MVYLNKWEKLKYFRFLDYKENKILLKSFLQTFILIFFRIISDSPFMLLFQFFFPYTFQLHNLYLEWVAVWPKFI